MKQRRTQEVLDAHARRIANRLQDMYGDEILTRAAELHGKISFEATNQVDNDAMEVVTKWRQIQLQVKQSSSAGLAALLEKWYAEKRALILFVVERYDHFDTDAEACTLSQRWRKETILPSFEELQKLRKKILEEVENEANRTEEKLRIKHYSIMADNLGMNTYRDAFDLMNFLVKDEIEVETAITKLAALTNNSHQEQFDIFKANISEKLDGRGKVLWKWEALDKILGKLEETKKRKQHLPVWDFGRITIDLPEAEECYQALSALCTAFDHRAEIIDSIQNNSATSKRRIDLTVLLNKTTKKEEKIQAINVSICLRNAELRHWRSYLFEDKERIIDSSISVFTRDGEVKKLPANASIIDFAYSIHSSFILYFDHALINGVRQFDILTPLAHGDKIELVRNNILQYPPAEWILKSPQKKRNLVKSWMKIELLKKGFKYFCINYLKVENFENLASKKINELKICINNVLSDSIHRFKKPNQIARLEKRNGQEKDSIGKRKIFADYFFIQLMFLHKDEMDWPKKNKSELNIAEVYRVAREVKKIFDEKSEIISKNRIEVNYKPNYYVLSGIDRTGLVFDILKVFYDTNTPIMEVVARSSFSGNIFVRVTSTTNSYNDKKLITEKLKQIVGNDVQCLGDTSLPSELESTLPQRMTFYQAEFVDAIPTNRPVYESHLFYGRVEEVNRIFATIKRGIAADALVGVLILIKGPLKMGKTSLALNVLQKVIHGYSTSSANVEPRIAVNIRLANGATVEKMTRRILHDEIAPKWAHFASLCGLPKTSQPPTSLEELFGTLKKLRAAGCPVILMVFIDEIMELFAAENLEKESNEENFRIFSNFFENTPGAILLIAGPQYPIQRLSEQMRNRLESFENIPTAGLDRKATLAMINREKLHKLGRLPVNIQASIAEKIYQETAGNPFWIANLTNELRTNNYELFQEYSDEIFDNFIRTFVAVNPGLFSDKFLTYVKKSLNNAFQVFKNMILYQVKNSMEIKFSLKILLAENSSLLRSDIISLLNSFIDTGGLKTIDGVNYYCSSPILEKWLIHQVKCNGLYHK